MLERARDGRQMLSLLTEPKNASSLVRSMSVDDLYVCLQMVGIGDSETVLALASGDQIQGILDIDGWQGDQMMPERIRPWMQALMRAGPEILTKRMLDLDDALLMHILRTHVDAYVVEDIDDFEPPNELHVFTPDNQTCLVFKSDQENSLPIRIFLDTLMRFDVAHCLNILAHLNSALLSNLEEQAYRWRAGRVADLGYVDYYEALKIYAPLPSGYMYSRPSQHTNHQTSLKNRALVATKQGDRLLGRGVSWLNGDVLERFHYETALASNMALSADRIELWDAEGQHSVLMRVRAGLELGLALSLDPSAPSGDVGQFLASKGAIQVFRIGYQAVQNAVSSFNRLVRRQVYRGQSGRIGALDVPLLSTWGERLSERHPITETGQIPSTLEQLELLRLWNLRLSILGELCVKRPLDSGILAWIWSSFLQERLTSVAFSPKAMSQLGASLSTNIEQREILFAKFVAWFSERSNVVDDVLVELLFEAAYDELMALGSGDLPDDVTPQYLYFTSTDAQ